ncbi:MAG TPA: hypothetical protein PKE26_02145 [Kiritimatiellia bacterium]|nr:hypothetical protein [Kiritimatiellia bacterium]HMO97890.1 hypothetical protein [Kiritimatiellia bacterium]HMP95590.1 hypothetical protein [Kiritimatiellia bacterium]
MVKTLRCLCFLLFWLNCWASGDEFLLSVDAYSGPGNKIETTARLRLNGDRIGGNLASLSPSGISHAADSAFISLMNALEAGDRTSILEMIDSEITNRQDPSSSIRFADFFAKQREVFRSDNLHVDYRLNCGNSVWYLMHSHDGKLDGVVYTFRARNGGYLWDLSESHLSGIIQMSFDRLDEYRIPLLRADTYALPSGCAVISCDESTNNPAILYVDLIQLDDEVSASFPEAKRLSLIEAFSVFQSNLPERDFDAFISNHAPEYRESIERQRETYWSMNSHWHQPVHIRCIAGLDPLYIVWYSYPGRTRLFNRQFIYDDDSKRFLVTNVNHTFPLLTLLEQCLVEGRFRFDCDQQLAPE